MLASASSGWAALAFALIPGTVLLSTGFSLSFWAGGLRIQQFMALGGFLSIVMAAIAVLWLSLPAVAVLIALSAASVVTAGWVALDQELTPPGAPKPAPDASLATKAALDEALLGWFTTIARVPVRAGARRVAKELQSLEEQGRDAPPETPPEFLVPPPPLEQPVIDRHRWRRYTYERIRFESGYRADARLPGAQRWHRLSANRTAYAWMLRHPGPPRPWVVGIHGYRMGHPLIDLGLFRPEWLFDALGYNVLVPVLPLHGPRRAGLLSGDFFLDGDVLNLVHAESQAIWDIRRLIGWLRNTQGACRVGVLGYSLGGYNAALLATVEAGLDCVIAGIPATDLARLQWRHMPEMPLRYLATLGADCARMQQVYRRVSPLAAPCRVPWAGRFIFAGNADRLVPADQTLALWRHWEQPLWCWYDGGHLTFRGRPEVRRFIDKALRSRLDAPTRPPAAEPGARAAIANLEGNSGRGHDYESTDR